MVVIHPHEFVSRTGKDFDEFIAYCKECYQRDSPKMRYTFYRTLDDFLEEPLNVQLLVMFVLAHNDEIFNTNKAIYPVFTVAARDICLNFLGGRGIHGTDWVSMVATFAVWVQIDCIPVYRDINTEDEARLRSEFSKLTRCRVDKDIGVVTLTRQPPYSAQGVDTEQICFGYREVEMPQTGSKKKRKPKSDTTVPRKRKMTDDSESDSD